MNMKNLFRSPLLLVALLAVAVLATSGGGFSNPLGWLTAFLYRVPGLIVGITLHEFAHAKSANLLGDPTPKIQGRLSLNPFRHFDLFGLTALVVVGFGWGKPVMVSPYYFKNKRRDSFIVDIAGVTTNFALAFVFMGILVFYLFSGGWEDSLPGKLLNGMIWANSVLMIFNLLPIPPLDGFNMVTELLDLRKYDFWHVLYSWGFPIILVLMVTGVTGKIMGPAMQTWLNGLFNTWVSIWGLVL